MCIGFSATITKKKVYYLLESNSHTDIDKEFGIFDNRPAEIRNHIHVECWPKGSLTSCAAKDWDVKIDEEGTLPDWYTVDPEKHNSRVLSVLFKTVIPSWIKDGVGGDLDLEGTKITSLGELRSVGGSLDLRDTKVTSLGKLQSVRGYLYLSNTKVTRDQASGIEVKGRVYF